jgi:predicted 2-oxoglutarate/Fe(II)-dependent dioxygenase YbiX
MTSTGRSVSAICYLNNDYEGGELEFPHFNLTIKPEPGMLILFPSNFAYAHIAHPIISGTKYALVTWLRDRDDV